MKHCAWLVLVCACASQAPQPSSGEPLVPLGKNAQGAEEFLRVIDGMVVIKIPAGEFIIGDDIRDRGEGPKRPATIDKEYFIDKFEVCNEQFARFLNAKGDRDAKHSFADPKVRGVEKVDGAWRALQGREKHPAACATYWGAEAYAQWAGGHLPSRLEWEKAARGTDGRTYPWGSDAPDATYCNYGPSAIGDTMPVGSYPKGASPYGVMDMAGNVYERMKEGGIKSSGFLCPMAFQMRASDGCGYARDTSNVSVGFRCCMPKQ